MQLTSPSLFARLDFSLGRIIQYSISSFSSPEDLTQIETFFAKYDNDKYKSGLEQGLDEVRANIGWVKRSTEDVRQWLSANGYLKA